MTGLFFSLTVKARKAAALTAAAAAALVLALHTWAPAVPADAHAAVSVPIIMYHSVCPDDSQSCSYVISAAQFENDMKYLRERGYTAVFVSQISDFVRSGAPLPEKPVAVTLDDGFYNSLSQVLPILEKYDMRATVSVVGAYAEKASGCADKDPFYAYLSWDDIRALAASGRVEIGSHSWDMHRLGARRGCAKMPGESGEAYARALESDLGRLQSALKTSSGIAPAVFAYPYGLISPGSADVLRNMGFAAALGCEEKVNVLTGGEAQLYHLGRFNRPAGISTEEFMKKITP
jgi:peptidoglycan/xylan/chitin deacetylase (PgdA/CDA1 family)